MLRQFVLDNVHLVLERLFWHVAAQDYAKADAQLELLGVLAHRLDC